MEKFLEKPLQNFQINFGSLRNILKCLLKQFTINISMGIERLVERQSFI